MSFRAQPDLTGTGAEAYSSGAYRDYSNYLQNGGELIKHKKSDRNFPVKLHRIVSDPSNSLVITWMVSGLQKWQRSSSRLRLALCDSTHLVSLFLNALR